MNIAAVLLAGGQSRRMRQDKATLTLHGEPLWQIQLELLRKLEPQAVGVSAREDPLWRPSDVQFVPDKSPSRGPLSGIAAALAQLSCSHVLALAIDMPFMTAEYLRSLCDRIDAASGVLPVIGDCYEPLAATYPLGALSDFTIALSGTDFSLQSLARKLIVSGKLRAFPVAKEDETLFRNLNEPADLKNWS